MMLMRTIAQRTMDEVAAIGHLQHIVMMLTCWHVRTQPAHMRPPGNVSWPRECKPDNGLWAAQVSARVVSDATKARVKRMVGGAAALALDLVRYQDAELAPAMRFAFGNTFICKVRRFSLIPLPFPRQCGCELHPPASSTTCLSTFPRGSATRR